MSQEIGSRIRARREHLKLTQQDVANALVTSRSNYSKYESGEVSVSAQDLARIADVLRLQSVAYLYGEDEKRQPEEIQYEPILDALHTASYSGGLEDEDMSEVAEIIRMKARRKAERQGRA